VTDDPSRITTLAALEALYGTPARASVIKETDRITAEYRALIEAAPFVVVASAGPDGLDCSPRGDAAPVVTVHDERTLLLPDRRGNQRIDTLRNLVRDPRLALLFLIPGVGETIRVNGRAAIGVTPELTARFAVDGKAPLSVIVIAVESVYFQCARAVTRAGLWDPAQVVARTTLPTCGQILAALDREPFDGDVYDAALPDRQRRTLY
jgi:hypothetical protein